MPAILFIALVRVIAEICRLIRGARANKPRPLCTDCAHAHLQYASNGRRAIACTFAGSVRPVQLDVMYCTDYHDRHAAPRRVSVGFVHQIAPAEVGTGAGHRISDLVRFRNDWKQAPRLHRLVSLSFRARPVHLIGVDRRGWGEIPTLTSQRTRGEDGAPNRVFAGGEDKGSIGSCGFESRRAPTSTRSSMAEQSLGDDSPAMFGNDRGRTTMSILLTTDD